MQAYLTERKRGREHTAQGGLGGPPLASAWGAEAGGGGPLPLARARGGGGGTIPARK
jgi:hypothetical protein